MKRCVIVGGSEIRNYESLRKNFTHDDYFIYCDCGLKHEKFLGHAPDLIIGDFDSHDRPENPDCEMIVLPVVKDDTDSIYAVKEAMKRGFDDFVLIGSTGGRTDHTLGNIYALLMLADNNKHAEILDDYSRMRIISADETVRIKYGCKFFSLINITGLAKGISITNAKYNLEDAEITSEYQYGISNEVLSPEHDAEIYIREGNLLLVIILPR
ncbi:MAG: thiamine diphosphokinase [Synergistaceae bacterium]|nr:thiamine diphosphokinase [Synergistaceae bacterium]